MAKFGYIGTGGTVSNLGVTNANIVASYNVTSSGAAQVGPIAGWNNGTITNSFATGTVSVNVAGGSPYNEVALNVGGLVGTNGGSITGSYATSAVSVSLQGSGDAILDVDASVGGLVGYSSGGSIASSFASGSVNISGAGMSVDFAVGGLVGSNYAPISNSYATGAVGISVTGASTSDDSGASAGGFVGYNNGSISYAYATGAVTVSITSAPDQSVGAYVGGLVGINDYSGAVRQTFATGR
jgi:hypothetical protein